MQVELILSWKHSISFRVLEDWFPYHFCFTLLRSFLRQTYITQRDYSPRIFFVPLYGKRLKLIAVVEEYHLICDLDITQFTDWGNHLLRGRNLELYCISTLGVVVFLEQHGKGLRKVQRIFFFFLITSTLWKTKQILLLNGFWFIFLFSPMSGHCCHLQELLPCLWILL